MRLRTVSVLLCPILLVSAVISARICVVNAWTGVVIIRTDGSVDPPTAPIQRTEDTYTLTGNITSNADGIVIERNSMTLDGAQYSVQGALKAESKGIALSGRNNITIENIRVKAFSYGIYLFGSSNNSICQSNLEANNWAGLHIEDSFNNSAFGNNVTSGNLDGIFLKGSSNNNISGNYVSDNKQSGLVLYLSSNNILSGNTFARDGLYVEDAYHNAVDDNLVNDKPLVYLEGMSNYVIEDAGQVVLVNCEVIRVEGLNLSDADIGVLLLGTNKTLVARNNIAGNNYGIRLDRSSNNSIRENSIISNWAGIWLRRSSNFNDVYRNVLKNNDIGGGFTYFSSSNNISSNNITRNNRGLTIDSSNNIVSKNYVMENDYGISVYSSSNNKIYHNNFLSNTNQVYCYESISIWDNGYPSGGNYWSDYIGVDSNNDGIGEMPHTLTADNIDHYPLINLYMGSLFPVNPVADFHFSPYYPVVGLTGGVLVAFDASDSSCVNGTITNYLWDFGDEEHGTGATPSHSYSSHGNYNVTLTVVSNSRLSSSVTKLVVVKGSPTASFFFSPTPKPVVGQLVEFDASSSTPRGGAIIAYTWRFGDGNVTSIADPIISHTFALQKTYNVTLTVSDSEGLNSSSFKLVKVWMPTLISISTNASTTFVGLQ